MPSLSQPALLRRAVEDPYAIAYETMALVTRAKGGKKGGSSKKKIKAGPIAGIVVAIIIAIIIICIIIWLVKRKQNKKKISGGH